ncbi:MAG: toll/interleukin-1 receptor domain-containing protein [Armatimonadetes bacterium]|nr:toll/interleukin-1 receptor domain-containing protein [Armatimonadota bacterium]
MAKLPEDPLRVVDAIAVSIRRDGDDRLLSILDVCEPEYDYLNEDWGISYYNLILNLPFETFATVESDQVSIEKRFTELASRATSTCTDSRVSNVILGANLDAPSDWRSGAKPTLASVSDADRIWKPGWFRLFVSHESGIKAQVAEFKTVLAKRHIDAFIAHEDIEPTLEWQEEISLSLASCHAVVAVISPAFHSSFWCQQEVGWGLGRGVLVLPIKLPNDPKGFIASVQAINGGTSELLETREQLVDTLAINERTRRQMHEPLIQTLERAQTTRAGNIIADSLERTQSLSEEHAKRIVAASNQNRFIVSDSELVTRLQAVAARYEAKSSTPTVESDEYDPFADD